MSPTSQSHIEKLQQALDLKQQDEAAQHAAYQKALNNLFLTPDFETVFVHGYLAKDVETKLQQLRDALVQDLPIARQRWLDAENMKKDLLDAIAEARQR